MRHGILIWRLAALVALRFECAWAQECTDNALQPKPVTVAYHADSQSTGAMIFKPTVDGVLLALDAETGVEMWAFAPPELDATHRAEGLMSDVRVLRFDADRDGSIDAATGDRVWLYFGMRRGGRYYHALDVTDRDRPRVLWKLGPNELPGVGETWSTPTIARVRVANAVQNGERFVLILGGGYDEAPPSAHRIFIVDAASGRLLWYGGGPGGSETPSAPDLALPQMADPIPGRIAAIDVDGDRFADRLYAADFGGRIWRLDVWNDRDRSQLVTGGVLASLGAAASSAPEDARRFFNAPDVAFIHRRGAEPYYNLAIGSGNRAQPFGTAVHERFYSIRDRDPWGKLPQSSYDALTPLLDSNLTDITGALASAAVPASAPGWKLELRLHGGWSGEKVLAEALTVNGVILFPTFQPSSAAATCADTGRNRAYALNVDHGNAVLDFNGDHEITDVDAAAALTQTGIASEVELTLPLPEAGGTAPPSGNEPAPASTHPGAECRVGRESIRPCITGVGPLRTFWRRDAIR